MRSYFNSVILFIVFLFVFSLFPIDGKADSINIKINGEDFIQSNESLIIYNRTYVPVRAFTNHMGYILNWDAIAKEVTIIKDEEKIKLFMNSRKVEINEKTLYMGSRVIMVDGRTYVPVRFLAEIYGNKVLWEAETSTIFISEIPTYIVEEGDTLEIISEKCGIGIDYIISWNSLCIDSLQMGDKLYLEPVEIKDLDELESNYILSYTDEEFEWLARIIYTEARGEPYAGLVAVGAVVINRVEANCFPNTIYDVIFQKSQFTPAYNGRIYNVKPDNDSYNAAEDALLGADPTKGALYFYNPSISSSSYFKSKTPIIKIGSHSFFK